MGHDITVPFDPSKSITDNSGPGKTFPGSPKCIFRGKEIPALVACSKNGSITSDILRQVFQKLDELEVYRREESLIPMVLFDAHDSRLQLPFLRYINTPEHKWKFCIGLPNGTHKWQVGDSAQQNGRWKVEWTREKAKLSTFRMRSGLPTCLEKSDILPLVNKVWQRSFADKEGNSKAIRERGWNPLNYVLLTDKEILNTKPEVLPNNDKYIYQLSLKRQKMR